jgi:hypothetical protein
MLHGENIAKSNTHKNGILYFVKILISPHKKRFIAEKNKETVKRILLIPKLKKSKKLKAVPHTNSKNPPNALTKSSLFNPCVKAYPDVMNINPSPIPKCEDTYLLLKIKNNSNAKIIAMQLVRI